MNTKYNDIIIVFDVLYKMSIVRSLRISLSNFDYKDNISILESMYFNR